MAVPPFLLTPLPKKKKKQGDEGKAGQVEWFRRNFALCGVVSSQRTEKSTPADQGRQAGGKSKRNPVQRRHLATVREMDKQKTTLHRCAIALCSNPAVAEGVCSMHFSRSSGASTTKPANSKHALGGSSGSGAGAGEADRFYRAGSHMALQPRGVPPSKKHKGGSSADASRAPSDRMERPYNNLSLTRENLAQMMHRSKHFNGGGFSAEEPMHHPYMASSYLSGGTSCDTPVSVHSDSEDDEGSMDGGGGEKETNIRREKNRIAARKSRQRKLDRISNLEDEKKRLEQHRDMLVQEIRSLEKQDTSAPTTDGSEAADSPVVASPTPSASYANADPRAQPMPIAEEAIDNDDYAKLQQVRTQIILAIETAYNASDILSTMQYLREDSIVSGPQNSSVHLRGKDALVLDYLCTTYLFGNIRLEHVKIDNGGPRSQHFRVHWLFSGIVKNPGVSMSKEFLELIDNVKGKRVTIEGVSNYSFSGDKVVYIHRTADQAKLLSSLVNLSR